MKTYTFTTDEIIILRDALKDYCILLKPLDSKTTKNRITTYSLASSIKNQLIDDVRLS